MNKSSVALLILLLLAIDQTIKIYVKTHFIMARSTTYLAWIGFAYIFWKIPEWPGALSLGRDIWPSLF